MQYRETQGTRGRTRLNALKAVASLGMMQAALKRESGRRWIQRRMPAPGHGPTDEQMDGGVTKAHIYGEADGGRRARLTLSYAGDPGNRFTVLALIESALLLATEPAPCGFGVPGEGGVLTPAVAFGERLAERLRAQGVTIKIDDL
jgi:short subunit dehydrogenase-like uncharacterized protein